MQNREKHLEWLQGLLALQLAPIGKCSLSVVCRNLYKVMVHDSVEDVSVRVLLCRDQENGRPFVSVMPGASRGPSVTFRDLTPGESDLTPIVACVRAGMATAIEVDAVG